MKHVTYADKSLLMSDESADCLLEYAKAISLQGSSDTVRLRAVGADGNEVEATLLLTPSVSIVAETASSDMRPPEDPEAVAYMRERIALLAHPRNITPEHREREETSNQDF